MSYNGYVSHIASKYRLAVSIAVIKTKPDNISLEDHIRELRNKVVNDEINSEDLSVSICSNDFNIDETDDIDVNNDDNYLNIDERNEVNNVDTLVLNDHDCNQSNNETEAIDVDMTDLTADLDKSITILDNYKEFNTEVDARNAFSDVMEVLRNIDGNRDRAKEIPKDTLHCIQRDILTSEDKLDTSQCFNEDNTFVETVDNSPLGQHRESHEQSRFNNKEICINNDIYQIIMQKDVFEEHSYTKDRNSECNKHTNCNKNYDQFRSKSTHETEPKKTIRNVGNKPYNNIEPSNARNCDPNRVKNINETTKECHEIGVSNEIPNDSQDTIIYTIPEDIQFNTYYSESQTNNMIIDDMFIHGNRAEKINDNAICATKNASKYTNVLKPSQKFDKIQEDINIVHKFDGNERRKSIITQIPSIKNTKTSKFPTESQIKNIHNPNKNVNKTIINNDVRDLGKVNIEQNNATPSQATQLSRTNKGTYEKNDRFNKATEKNSRKIIKNTTNNNITEESIINIDLSTNNNNAFDNRKTNIEEINTVKRKVVNVDNDLFSQELQTTNFSILSTNVNQMFDESKRKQDDTSQGSFVNFLKSNTQSYIENNTAFSQYAQNKDFESNFELQKAQISNSKKQKTCPVLDNNSKAIQDNNKDYTNFDANLYITQTLDQGRKINTDLTKSCTNFDTSKTKQDHVINDTDFDNSTTVESKTFQNPTEVTEDVATAESCTDFDKNSEIDELTDSENELIPFKVIEELNKVKMYLNRGKQLSIDAYSSDTGYKSDSQSKFSFRASQSNNWLNQSAHSLFNFILECQLLNATQDITDEISMILGNLIDKLHEDEIYPSFLEQLLETVELMLNNIYEEHPEENVLLKKDDTIHRLILLNKSTHIQKYTIEKITKILEDSHKELIVQDALYEIKNIDKIENLCYVFHILHTLLQKYEKSDITSQSSQNSQEKILKKSSITDIWRRKWNPEVKESLKDDSEKTCPISDCNFILNKLIVDCMDGYSLISYYALKCFNVLQS